MRVLDGGAWYATGIGSLPHQEAAAAVRVVMDNFEQIPHWPQLPARGDKESFIRQFLGYALNIGLFIQSDGGKVRYMGEHSPELLTAWYEAYLQAYSDDDYGKFGLDEESAAGFTELLNAVKSDQGFIKGQVSGPLTVGFAINNEDLRAVWYDDQIRDVIVKSLAAGAKWQVRSLCKTGRQVILFVDEPGLYMFGQSSFVAVSRDDIVAALSEVLSAAREESALTGVHVCAGCDWSIVLACPVDIVSFDANNYMSSLLPYSDAVAAFLARGGVLAWGAVPTDSEAQTVKPEAIIDTIRQGMDKLEKRGVDRSLLLDRAMITPACGTGTLSLDTAAAIYRLTRQAQEMLRSGGL